MSMVLERLQRIDRFGSELLRHTKQGEGIVDDGAIFHTLAIVLVANLDVDGAKRFFAHFGSWWPRIVDRMCRERQSDIHTFRKGIERWELTFSRKNRITPYGS